MNKQDFLRISEPLIEAFEKKRIKFIKGNAFRRTQSFGDDFFNKYSDKLPLSMHDFYSMSNGYSDFWETIIPIRNDDEQTTEKGIINIQPLDELFEENNLVQLNPDRKYYIEGEKGFLKTGSFIPVDYIEDICAGVFSKENNDEMMYFHDFGIGFYPLKVNLEGYIELAFAARGYMMWPYVLVYLEYGKNDPAKFGESTYEDFAEDMPLIFPDFKLDKFIALYESLKINKDR